MPSFKEILEHAEIEPVKSYNTASLVEDTLPKVDSVNTFDEFTAVCEQLELPMIHKEMLSVESYYRNILVYLINISSKVGMDMSEVMEKNKEVEEYLSLDEKADALEIRLAGLKNSYELSHVEQSKIVQEVDVLEKIKDLDKETLFAVLKSDRKIQRMLKKDELLQKIYAMESSVLKSVLIKFIESDFVDIHSIEEMGIDRITALKLVHQLCMKEIVTYDQINDQISLKK